MLALLIYREEQWGWLGITLGLLALTRPEGLALAVAVGCVELWRHKGIRRGIVIAGLLCALICGPWFGYLLWRTGHILPTTRVGKQMALPPPHIPIGAALGNPDYALSVWAIVGWVSVIVPLLWMAGRRVATLRQWPDRVKSRDRRPMIVFLVWAALHNLSYMMFMPALGTASRYGALNHVALWLALALGLLGHGHRARLWLAGGLIVVTAANTVYWNGVYDANLDHMQGVRIAAAHFVRGNLSLDEQCAASDVGAMRYYSQRPIVDLCGLIDPNAGQWFLRGEYDRYVVESD